MIAWFDANDKARTGPVGCVGHCMSGWDITTVSMRFSHRRMPAASLHGTNIVTAKLDSSHQMLPRMKGEPCYALAEHDQSVPATRGAGTAREPGENGCRRDGEGVRRHPSWFLLRRTSGLKCQGRGTDLADIFDLWKRRLAMLPKATRSIYYNKNAASSRSIDWLTTTGLCRLLRPIWPAGLGRPSRNPWANVQP